MLGLATRPLEAEVGKLEGHEGDVLGAWFDPAGERIATISDDQTVRIWDAGGRPLQVLRGHTEAVLDLDWSPDGITLATIALDGTARLWDARGQRPSSALPIAGRPIAVRFHPAGRFNIR